MEIPTALRFVSQIGFGCGLLYGTDKFFKLIEDKLSDDAKLEIAVWLLGVKIGEKVRPWPLTFTRMFDRLFGSRHVSLRCLGVSFAATIIAVGVIQAVNVSIYGRYWRLFHITPARLVPAIVLCNLFPDYLCLLETRLVLRSMAKASVLGKSSILVFDFIFKMLFGTAAIAVGAIICEFVIPQARTGALYAMADVRVGLADPNVSLWLFPLFVSSLWLWTYFISGFIVKFARRFDIGVDWFNRHFDIEKRPLQCIGLVSGMLAAIVYWSLVVVNQFSNSIARIGSSLFHETLELFSEARGLF